MTRHEHEAYIERGKNLPKVTLTLDDLQRIDVALGIPFDQRHAEETLAWIERMEDFFEEAKEKGLLTEENKSEV